MDTPLTLLAEALPYVQEKHLHSVIWIDGAKNPVKCERCELAARITAMLDSGGWVKVEDRLPPDPGPHDLVIYMQRYLVATTGGPTARTDGRLLFPVVIANFFGKKYAAVHGGWDVAEVTHWQPLPPLPKG